MSETIQGRIQLIFVVIFIAGAFIASAMLGAEKAPTKQQNHTTRTPTVSQVVVTPGINPVSFETTGIIQAQANVDITPQISGRVIKVNKNMYSGGIFTKGETLFEIDPQDYKLALRQSEATLAQAKTDFDLEKAESDIALAEWKQLNPKAIPPALVARKPQLEAARTALDSAQAAVEQAKLDLSRTKFALPFHGRVVSNQITEGQYLSAGQSYASAYDLMALEVQSSLNDEQLTWLLGAQEPEINITTHYQGEETTYKGTLKRAAADFDETARFASVHFGFKDNNVSASLLPGVFTTIHVTGPSIEQSSLIPIEALQKDGKIWTINPEDKTVHSINPDIIFTTDEYALIRNFTEETRVVTSQASSMKDGSQVNIEGMEDKETTNKNETGKP